MHHIIRLQIECFPTFLDNETILDVKLIGLRNLTSLLRQIRVIDSAAHIYTCQRSPITKTTCLNNEILNGCIICIFVIARSHHFTRNGKYTFLTQFLLGWNKHDILVLQWNVSYSARHNTFHINRNHLQCAVFLQTVNDGVIQECIFCQTISSLYQRAH